MNFEFSHACASFSLKIDSIRHGFKMVALFGVCGGPRRVVGSKKGKNKRSRYKNQYFARSQNALEPSAQNRCKRSFYRKTQKPDNRESVLKKRKRMRKWLKICKQRHSFLLFMR